MLCQVLGDPTVAVFGSRDVDSYLTQREKAAVGAWLVSGKQFNVLRDGPFHMSVLKHLGYVLLQSGKLLHTT